MGLVFLALCMALLAPMLTGAEDHVPDPIPPDNAVNRAFATVTGSATANAGTLVSTDLTPTAMLTPTVAPTATTLTLLPPTATIAPTATPPPATATATTAPASGMTTGLTMIGDGAAAYYAAAYDRGGWDAIIRAHLRFGHADAATFPYSPDGYYCVHPDYAFGNVLTLQNPRTGATIRCTVADAVAPGDIPVWRSRWQIELSTAAFDALGLGGGNRVTVWAKR